MDSSLNRLVSFHWKIARGNQKNRAAPDETRPVAKWETRSMKYVFLLVFVVTALGTAIAGRAMSAAPRQPGNISVRSAAELYLKNCASCHGKDGRAKTFKAKLNHVRNLADPEWQGRVSDERIFNSIMNGKGKMPPYGKKLSEQEIDALVAYVRGLKK
jgi:mono/diheme cytochrome c family protein